MDTKQTDSNSFATTPGAPRRRLPRRATMGDDWQISVGPTRPAPAPQPVRQAAPQMGLGAWLSRLFATANDALGADTRQPMPPTHPAH